MYRYFSLTDNKTRRNQAAAPEPKSHGVDREEQREAVAGGRLSQREAPCIHF